MIMTDNYETIIKQVIENNDVVLFLKGTAQFPQCGFSAAVSQILETLEITYTDVNVLENRDMFEVLKTYSKWPTSPQLYVKGEFVGGCDIIREMYEEGELKELFAEKGLLAAK
jgi:monothiol glutaredoxin